MRCPPRCPRRCSPALTSHPGASARSTAMSARRSQRSSPARPIAPRLTPSPAAPSRGAYPWPPSSLPAPTNAAGPTSRWAHRTALIARFRADRRPQSRAPNDVSTSTRSRTRSSVTSPQSSHQSAPVRRRRSLQQLSVHPPQPIPMLHHHGGHPCGSANSRCTLRRAVHPRPDLASTRTTIEPACAAHSQIAPPDGPRHRADHHWTHAHTGPHHRRELPLRVGVDQHRALVYPHRRHRESSFPTPAVRRRWMQALPPRPLREVHPTRPDYPPEHTVAH